MRIIPASKSSLAMLLASALMSAVSSASAGVQFPVVLDGVEISAGLSDSLYLEDEPVCLIIAIRNTSTRTVQDVSPLLPGEGYLRLELYRESESQQLPMTLTTGARFRSRPSADLAPGARKGEVLDLITYFGQEPIDSSGLAARLGFKTLPTGQYHLKCELQLHTGFLPGIEPVTQGVQSLDFAIRARGENPAEALRIEKFLAHLPSDTMDRAAMNAHAFGQLKQFYGSRYLPRIFLAAGVHIREVDIENVIRGMRANGVPPSRRAAFLGLYLRTPSGKRQNTQEWRGRIGSVLQSAAERAVLEGYSRGK